MSYSDTVVFLVCFSTVSATLFEAVIQKWVPEVIHHCPETPIILVGTKCDLKQDMETLKKLAANEQAPVTKAQAIELAKKLPNVLAYVECSSLSGEGMKDIRLAIIGAASFQDSSSSAQKDGKCLVQ